MGGEATHFTLKIVFLPFTQWGKGPGEGWGEGLSATELSQSFTEHFFQQM
jgi:hypothetical protein